MPHGFVLERGGQQRVPIVSSRDGGSGWCHRVCRLWPGTLCTSQGWGVPAVSTRDVFKWDGQHRVPAVSRRHSVNDGRQRMPGMWSRAVFALSRKLSVFEVCCGVILQRDDQQRVLAVSRRYSVKDGRQRMLGMWSRAVFPLSRKLSVFEVYCRVVLQGDGQHRMPTVSCWPCGPRTWLDSL